MNKKMIQRCFNFRIRLRPIPRRYRSNLEQPEEDWIWHVEDVNNDGVVTLRNISTDHKVKLGSDHLRNFDSDHQSETDGFKHGFFTLKGHAKFVDGQFIVETNPENN